jgi:hypothetical protein
VVLKVDDGTGLPCGVSTDTLVVEAKLREE